MDDGTVNDVELFGSVFQRHDLDRHLNRFSDEIGPPSAYFIPNFLGLVKVLGRAAQQRFGVQAGAEHQLGRNGGCEVRILSF